MCWMCNHPGATWDDYLDEMRRMVAARGFAVQAVMGDRLRCGYAYTVGLSEVGEPELLVTGMSQRRAYQLLHDMAHHVLHDTAPPTGPVIQCIEVEVPDVHLAVAASLYGPAVRALQLVWRDAHGKWPWDVGHRAGKGGQPVLGSRAVA